MKRISFGALAGVGLVSLMFAGGAWAQSGEKAKEISGRVESIYPARDVLMLNTGIQLNYSRNTKVLKDGKTASLRDIKQGDEVRVSFPPGSNETYTLHVTSGQGAQTGP
jgi:hypothetical protein